MQSPEFKNSSLQFPGSCTQIPRNRLSCERSKNKESANEAETTLHSFHHRRQIKMITVQHLLFVLTRNLLFFNLVQIIGESNTLVIFHFCQLKGSLRSYADVLRSAWEANWKAAIITFSTFMQSYQALRPHRRKFIRKPYGRTCQYFCLWAMLS